MTRVGAAVSIDTVADDVVNGVPAAAALVGLAELAEERGIELLVLLGPGAGAGSRAGEGAVAGLDPWTTAVHLVASTDSITVGVAAPPSPPPDPTDAEAPSPHVLARSEETVGALAPGRVLTDPGVWQLVPPDASDDDVLALAATSGVVPVVPVRDRDDVERVSALARRAAQAAHPPSAAGDAAAGAAPRRSLGALARRSPGVDYEGVPDSLAATAVEPGDPGYRAVASTYMRGGSPALVLRPTDPSQVSDALGFARRHRELPLGIRSGGHGMSGRSTNAGGLVVDVGRMGGVEILDADRRLLRVGPGTTWKQVAATIGPRGWAISSGDYGGVGVGGIVTAGGIGLMGRAHGLAIDHVRALEVVLADGTPVRADAQHHPDLFWGMRGAGANLGVVTAAELEAAPVTAVGWAQLAVVVPDLPAALVELGRVQEQAPRDTTVFTIVGRSGSGQGVLRLYGVVASEDPQVVVDRLTPFAELGSLVQQDVRITGYADVMGMAPDVGPGGHHGAGDPVARSGFATTITPALAGAVDGLLAGGASFFFQIRAMGGAIGDVAPDATAFGHRDARFALSAVGRDEDELTAAWSPLRPHLRGLYLSFETGTGPDRIADAFPPRTLARLRELKRRYDPDGLLRDNFALSLGEPVEPAVAG